MISFKYIRIGKDNDLQITHQHAYFTYLIAMQGSNGNAYGTYIVSGYDIGTTARNHYSPLIQSNSIKLELSGDKIIIKNNSGTFVDCKIYALLAGIGELSLIGR